MRVSFSGADDESLCQEHLEIEDESINTVEKVVSYVFEHEPRARKSFFKQDGTLTNGTICLIDEEDVEIRKDKELDRNSRIVFISTLHGG